MKNALLIGIEYLNDSSAQIAGCHNDALNIKNLITNHFNYKNENIVLLTDNTEKKPTKRTICNELNQLLSKINSGKCNEAVIHYAGHGSQIYDYSGDEKDRKDEIILPVDFNTAGIISDDYFYKNFIQKITNDQVTVTIIMDCCHSATILDLPYHYKFLNGILKKTKNHNKHNKGNIICFSGCKDNQTATGTFGMLGNNKWTGVMTTSLVHSVKQHNYNISFFKLIKEIQKHCRNNGYSQIPQLTSNFNIDNKLFLTLINSNESNNTGSNNTEIQQTIKKLQNEINNLTNELNNYQQKSNHYIRIINYLQSLFNRYYRYRSLITRYITHFTNLNNNLLSKINNLKNQIQQKQNTIENLQK